MRIEVKGVRSYCVASRKYSLYRASETLTHPLYVLSRICVTLERTERSGKRTDVLTRVLAPMLGSLVSRTCETISIPKAG